MDRAFFYVWANKEGTVVDEAGKLCVAGTYFPAWTGETHTYPVKGAWLDKLFKAYKLSFDNYDEYMHLARDGVLYRKRNLDACREWAEKRALHSDMEARTKRIQSNPEIYQPFDKPVPEAVAWLDVFKKDALRYPMLVVHAPSFTGKTEWALSLFKRPLELKVGMLTTFPETMRSFNPKLHDGIVLDDVRDMNFLVEHQEKLQGKYNGVVEFGSTAGGTCAYWRNLYGVPVVVTVNNSTRNLDFLATDDFLSNPGNVHLVRFSGRPGEAPPQTKWTVDSAA